MTDRQAEALEVLKELRDKADDQSRYEIVRKALERQQGIIKSYENLAFRFGAMLDPPCFRCGYEGEGYFQSDTHPCAERHHELYRWRKSPAEPEQDG